jgi:hypothetical protein
MEYLVQGERHVSGMLLRKGLAGNETVVLIRKGIDTYQGKRPLTCRQGWSRLLENANDATVGI